MADEKSIVKMNKIIHKKTGASFLVVYVIYISLVYTDSKKTLMNTNFPRMFRYMIFSNASTFTSLLSGLKESENKTEQKFLSSTNSI